MKTYERDYSGGLGIMEWAYPAVTGVREILYKMWPPIQIYYEWFQIMLLYIKNLHA